MDVLMKEFSILDMITEDTEERIICEYFFESGALNTAESIIATTIEKISGLIKNTRGFILDILNKFKDKQAQTQLNKLVKSGVKEIDATLQDKEITAYCKKLGKIQQTSLTKLRKIHDQVMSGKISPDVAMKQMDSVLKETKETVKNLEKTDPIFSSGKKKANRKKWKCKEVSAYLTRVNGIVSQTAKRIGSDCTQECERIKRSVKDVKKVSPKKASAIKFKLATAINTITRIVGDKTMIAFASAVAATGISIAAKAYKNHQNKKYEDEWDIFDDSGAVWEQMADGSWAKS